MPNAESDFDAFRDDFLLYLAARLGVSKDAALGYLGDWLIAVSSTARPLARTAPKSAFEEPELPLPAASGADKART